MDDDPLIQALTGGWEKDPRTGKPVYRRPPALPREGFFSPQVSTINAAPPDPMTFKNMVDNGVIDPRYTSFGATAAAYRPFDHVGAVNAATQQAAMMNEARQAPAAIAGRNLAGYLGGQGEVLRGQAFQQQLDPMNLARMAIAHGIPLEVLKNSGLFPLPTAPEAEKPPPPPTPISQAILPLKDAVKEVVSLPLAGASQLNSAPLGQPLFSPTPEPTSSNWLWDLLRAMGTHGAMVGG